MLVFFSPRFIFVGRQSIFPTQLSSFLLDIMILTMPPKAVAATVNSASIQWKPPEQLEKFYEAQEISTGIRVLCLLRRIVHKEKDQSTSYSALHGEMQ